MDQLKSLKFGNETSNVAPHKISLTLVPIRIGVIEAIKSWMETFYVGGADDPVLLAVIGWANGHLRVAFSGDESQSVIALVQSRLTAEISPSILPNQIFRGRTYQKLCKVDITEMTEQITIQQMDLYRKIKPIHCLDKAWSMDKASPNNDVRKMIQYDTKASPCFLDLNLAVALGCWIDFDGKRR